MMSGTFVARAQLPSDFGQYDFIVMPDAKTGAEHVVLVHGDVLGKSHVLVRVHSECMTGDLFASLRCDCRSQLLWALARIQEADCGILVYLRQEGRGIGLTAKIRAYALQEDGLDTFAANEALGYPADCRTYEAAAAALRTLGVASICLLSSNPEKMINLQAHGIVVAATEDCPSRFTAQNCHYLDVKRKRLNHRITEHKDLPSATQPHSGTATPICATDRACGLTGEGVVQRHNERH